MERNDSEATIDPAGEICIPESGSIEYDGGAFTLSIILGILAGLNKTCCLKYSVLINPDIIDSLVDVLNDNGIDIFHEADSKTVVIRAGTEIPIEIKIDSSLSYLKNCLLIILSMLCIHQVPRVCQNVLCTVQAVLYYNISRSTFYILI